jgi:hypothetical protein
MKKHLNLATLLMVAVVVAGVLGHFKGMPVSGPSMFGFSSGG